MHAPPSKRPVPPLVAMQASKQKKHEQRQAGSETAAAPRGARQVAAGARHDTTKREGAEKMEGLLLGLAWTGWTRLG